MLQGVSGLNFITKVKSKIKDLHYLLGLFDCMDTCISNCVYVTDLGEKGYGM